MDRFLRTERLIGPQAFSKLNNSMVTIAGIGAVGGYAIEGLARAGVGHLRIVDFDRVARHNINRQLVALESTIGQKKAALAKARIADINPQCQVEALDQFVDKDSLPAILDPRPDLVIDAIDALNSKIELLVTCYEMGIPVLSSMGAALRTDASKVRMADIMETSNCPLAKRIRKRLRRRGIEKGIRCVYSFENVDFTYRDPALEEPDENEVPEASRGRERRVLGSLPTLTGIFGLTLANMAIEQLIKK